MTPADATAATPALRVTGLKVTYGSIRALRGVDLELAPQRLMALLGANGSGKTSVLRALTGLLASEGGRITGGDVLVGDRSVRTAPPEEIARLGVAHVPQGRRVFGRMTVEENLLVGGHLQPRSQAHADARDLLDRFELIGRRRRHPAGLLSGGEQQLLAVGRALMSRPTVLLLDEPTLGLAPLVASSIVATIAALVEERGITALLVEQNAVLALRHASRAAVLDRGRLVRQGSARVLAEDPELAGLYLGGGVHEQRLEAG